MSALIVLAFGFSIAIIRLSWSLAMLADAARDMMLIFLKRGYQEDPGLDPEVPDDIPEHILAWIGLESEDWAKEDLKGRVQGLYQDHGDWDLAFRSLVHGHAGWGEVEETQEETV